MKTKLKRLVYPVSLFVEGNRCLVVGGGKVAFRKAAGLIEAGAAVSVVSPELDERFKIMVAEQRLNHIPRKFAETDPEGCTLVFAATGRKYVNRQVLAACRARRVLCCPVDGNWVEGDFVTPATLRKGHLTVSISTGGQNCRRSRLIKNSLLRHIDMVDTADLAVMGTSHRQLTIKEREPFHMSDARLDETGRLLTHVWGIHEFMLLNTCNRVELLAVKTRSAGVHDLLRKIMGFDRMDPAHYYIKRGLEAFEHLALLTAGLFSLMSGENHIVSQVKNAYDQAVERGWAGGMAGEWTAAALHISKDIRQQIFGLLPKGDIEDACIEYLNRNAGGPEQRMAVLGTGVIGQGMVRRLAATNRPCDWYYHHHAPSGELVPPGVRLRPWRDLADHLCRADVVICATSSPQPVLGPAEAAWFQKGRAVLLIDLSTPRNIDPAIGRLLAASRLADQDILKEWRRTTVKSLEPALIVARATIAEHRELYDKIIENFQNRDKGE